MRHEALLYDTEEAYASEVGRVLSHAAHQRRPVLLAVAPNRVPALSEMLDGDESQVVDMPSVGRNPSRIIPAIQGFLDAHGRDAVVVTEAVWPGRSKAELAEVTRHEALVNCAFGGTGVTFVCAYGAGAPRQLLGDVRRTHPQVRKAGGPSMTSRSYTDPGTMWRSTGRLAKPSARTLSMRFSAGGLTAVREIVRARALVARLTTHRVDDLVLAVSELASNSVRHGPGYGELRIWVDPDAIYCEVQDRGRLEDPLAGRRQPPPGSENGRGLWIVNQLCDLVQLYATTEGVTVRVRVER